MNFKYENVLLSVSTYEDLRQRGEAVIWFVEQAYERIFRDLLPHVPDRVVMYGCPVVGVRNREFAFNEKNWARFRRELLDGLLEMVSLVAWFKPAEDDPYARSRGAAVRVQMRAERPGEASMLEVGAVRSLYDPRPAVEWQGNWVDLACEAFVRLRGANGHLTVDNVSWRGGVSTSYEVMACQNRDVRLHFRSLLRGYHWGNLLSRGHIERLGGMEAVTREAPCYLVRELAGGEDRRVYLQLTPDIESISDDELRALRDYLRVLLPVQKHPFRWDPRYVRLRLIYDEETVVGPPGPPAGAKGQVYSTSLETVPCSLSPGTGSLAESAQAGGKPAIPVVWFARTEGEEIWDPAVFTLYLDRGLQGDEQKELVEVIEAWLVVGEYGGFGGEMFGSPAEVTFEENVVDWTAEMERVPEPRSAVDVLVRCLERFAAKRGLGVQKLVLGGETVE